MSLGVSARLAALPASATLAVNSKAKALVARGVDVLSFAAGEPDFDTPEHIRRAAAEAADQGQTRYTPAKGSPALLGAICRYMQSTCGLAYEPAEVVAGVGAKHALYEVFQALLDPGDRVFVPAPFWVSYPPQVALAGGVVVPVASGGDFLVTADGLSDAIARSVEHGGRARALVLNSPSNPTGAAYGRAPLEDLVEVALSAGLVIISDEIYHRLTYDGFEHQSVAALSPEVRARTVTINGVSKTFAMTGWRIGWACGERDLMAAVARLQSQSTSNPASVAQAAAVAALDGADDFLSAWLDAYAGRRVAMVEGLRALPGVDCTMPSGAFYAFPSVAGVLGRRTSAGQTLATDTDIAMWLLDEARVATVPGTPFGAPGHLRLSYACSIDQVRAGLARVGEALSTLT